MPQDLTTLKASLTSWVSPGVKRLSALAISELPRRSVHQSVLGHWAWEVYECEIMFLGKFPGGDKPAPRLGGPNYPLESAAFFSELCQGMLSQNDRCD